MRQEREWAGYQVGWKGGGLRASNHSWTGETATDRGCRIRTCPRGAGGADARRTAAAGAAS